MNVYVVLLRGINVGGKNKVSMAELRQYLEDLECADVRTYINSGNVLLRSKLSNKVLGQKIEKLLPQKFKLDSSIVRVLVLTADQLRDVIKNKPKGFGEQPDVYHSDAIFLMDLDIEDAMTVFDPREGVDVVWPGKGVVYSRRLSAQRTKSRLGKIVGTQPYQSMTIRSWKTTLTLADLAAAMMTE